MDRRRFLTSAFASGAIAVAGCSSDSETSDESSPTETPDKTPEKRATVTDHSFEVIGSAAAEHYISKAENGEYIVEGTVAVKDGCTTIELGSVTVVEGSDPPTVNAMIGTKETTEEECTKAEQDVGYRLIFTTEGDAVEEIQVVQEGVNSRTTTLTVEG
ncbi:hypothetical protein [Haloarcula laminariae]|uniref:hypothetical protein n=1 Tax=Haloarcula laminariae TaxID=2961577 RepID=UPI002405C661|nr:hypothetical protein [Halomicroarcula sp. FL173]